MTNEELRHKYRLQQLAAEQDVRTYHALDGAGHLCMVHFLPANSPETARLVALLDRLNPGDRARIIERVQVDGAPVLVTQLIAGFETLAAWLEPRAEGVRAVPAPPAAPRRAGEMTQIFGPASSPTPPAPPAPRDEPRAAALPPAPPPSAAPAPSGLTQMFGAPSGATPQPPPAEPPRSPPPTPGRAPGELTQLFGSGGGAPASPTPPAPTALPVPTPADQAATVPTIPINRPGKPPPGEKPSVRWRDEPARPANRTPDRPVVKWKKDVTPDLPRDAHPAPPPARPAPPTPPPPAPETPRAKPPGEFTRLFGAVGSSGTDDQSTPPPSPPPAARDPWDLARGVGPLTPPPSTGPMSPPPANAPGEFTRMFEPQKNIGLPAASSPSHGLPDFFASSSPPPAPHAPAPPAPPSAPQPPGEFTRLMQGAGGAPGMGGAPAAPGDFTRMLAASPLPTAAAPPSAAPADQEAPRRPPLVLLVIALGSVGLVALALVLYFALK